MSAEYDLVTNAFGILANAPRALIALTGDDCLEWLQGQATNDIRPLAPGSPVSFCLCTPTGQIEAVVDAFAFPDRILLSTDIPCREAVLQRVEQMVVMEDVEAEDLTPLGAALAVGPLSGAVDAPIRVVVGHRVELWGGAPASPAISQETYNLWRLERGIPAWGADITAKTLPPELGKHFESNHVSYVKGCFTGQEILHRIYSRGHTNKTWMGLLSQHEMPVGAPVLFGEKQVGTITSAAHSLQFGHIAAATLRNEAANEGTEVSVNGSPATVKEMPFGPRPTETT